MSHVVTMGLEFFVGPAALLWIVGVALLVCAAGYFFPSFLALWRGHMRGGAIFALNLLAGWTLIGWIVALVWAASGDTTTAARLRAEAARQAAAARAAKPTLLGRFRARISR